MCQGWWTSLPGVVKETRFVKMTWAKPAVRSTSPSRDAAIHPTLVSPGLVLVKHLFDVGINWLYFHQTLHAWRSTVVHEVESNDVESMGEKLSPVRDPLHKNLVDARLLCDSSFPR
jgi:hypothetical protein